MSLYIVFIVLACVINFLIVVAAKHKKKDTYNKMEFKEIFNPVSNMVIVEVRF